MISSAPFTVACPSCLSEFPVDPDRVPDGGVHAICSSCLRVFPVSVPGEVGAAEWLDHSIEVPEEVSTETAVEGRMALGEEAVAEGPAVRERTAPEPEGIEGAELGTPVSEEPVQFEDLTGLASEALSESASTSSASTGTGGSLSSGASRFASRDPHDRARRLARVLVSDIIAYYPTRYRESLSRGTLKDDFEEEVKKSWKEYVDQVGDQLAESTPYFDEALNDILAKGEDLF